MNNISLFRDYIHLTLGEVMSGEEWAEVSSKRMERGMSPIDEEDLVDYEEYRENSAPLKQVDLREFL